MTKEQADLVRDYENLMVEIAELAALEGQTPEAFLAEMDKPLTERQKAIYEALKKGALV
jgi:hypothetical protein